jgi:hypothetical protein
MVTICTEVYDPGPGENVGVAVGRLITYAALPTSLLLNPVTTAIALIVSEADTVTGPLYGVELVVGVEPSVV